MRVGIITFHRAKNYGALLQCYALYSYLKKNNLDVEIIDYRNPVIENTYHKLPKIRKNLIKYTISLLHSIFNYKKLCFRDKYFEDLRLKMNHSKMITKSSFNDLNYDVYIAGSDQLWNPSITKGLDPIYFLNFVKKGIKATYAMSMGNINNKIFSEKVFDDMIGKLDYISMREKDATEFMKSKETKREVVQCIDPTLLLTSNDWDSILSKVNIKLPSKYVFIYYIKEDLNLIKMADKIAKEHNLPIVYINVYQKSNVSFKFKSKVYNIIEAGPTDFIYAIKNASYVVTSSFHATAFSCMYKKDIYILPHNVTGSRVTSLSEIFGIKNRVYKSYEDFCERYKKDFIKYNEERYIFARNESIKYLDNICKKEVN